jgi:hypothetical protein
VILTLNGGKLGGIEKFIQRATKSSPIPLFTISKPAVRYEKDKNYPRSPFENLLRNKTEQEFLFLGFITFSNKRVRVCLLGQDCTKSPNRLYFINVLLGQEFSYFKYLLWYITVAFVLFIITH